MMIQKVISHGTTRNFGKFRTLLRYVSKTTWLEEKSPINFVALKLLS